MTRSPEQDKKYSAPLLPAAPPPPRAYGFGPLHFSYFQFVVVASSASAPLPPRAYGFTAITKTWAVSDRCQLEAVWYTPLWIYRLDQNSSTITVTYIFEHTGRCCVSLQVKIFFSWSLARRLYTAWIFLLFPVHVSRTLQFFNEGQTLSLTDMVQAIPSHVLCSAAEREESATVVDHCSNIREVFKEQREVIELHWRHTYVKGDKCKREVTRDTGVMDWPWSDTLVTYCSGQERKQEQGRWLSSRKDAGI